MKRERLVVGLDVGTTKVACLIANVVDDFIEIIGVGVAPSRGLEKGVVVDIGRTIQSIRKAVEEAENMADVKVREAYVGIAGKHIRSINNSAIISITRSDRIITQEDVRRVIEAARAIPISPDLQIIHIIPRQYIVDGQEGITDPVGMTGTRLEADVHIVLGSVTAVHNLVRCVEAVGIGVKQIVLEPLASAMAVLSSAEKELGVVLLDCGGGTTDISVFRGGDIWFSKTIPIAGEHITNDITVGLQTPIEEAERIKKLYGTCLVDAVGDDEKIEVATLGGEGTRQVSRKKLAKIIEPRVEEILDLAMQEVEEAGYRDLIPAGMVLTGGTSLLHGIVEFAQRRYGIPVRRGSVPKNVHGFQEIVESPIFATGVGLLKFAVEGRDFARTLQARRSRGMLARLFGWFRQFLRGGA
ncbi:MAG: cell division protein FtsA [Candidatus Bipolaricaulaceae bacterium]|nr:cell division protein FtsA [Candidatus Bipolaricaulota bacterium]MCX7844053.1 cell division protein FtsA [Candidatus Bipolaricaulota bacterium]MDW8151960.1 cell division protein FtsA [Candidatus Bipolaricaulota bacterium]